MIAIGGFLQNPAVEFKPGKLAIDETVRRMRKLAWPRGDLLFSIHNRDRCRRGGFNGDL